MDQLFSCKVTTPTTPNNVGTNPAPDPGRFGEAEELGGAVLHARIPAGGLSRLL